MAKLFDRPLTQEERFRLDELRREQDDDPDWLESECCVPDIGQQATGKQWMYWFDKREREARNDD